MQTSGLVLDVYDDVGGNQFKSFFPSREDIPGFVKQASALDATQREQLPDEAFALVMINGDEKLRKFACIDEGNTALSVLYFIKNAHKLPIDARVRAAENLKVASGWFDLDIPEELEKEALLKMVAKHVAKNPMGTAMTAMTAVPLAQGTVQGMRENLAQVHAGEDAAGVSGGMATQGMERLASANLAFLQMKMAMAQKTSDVTGTALAPTSHDDTDSGTVPPQQTIKKSASAGRLVPGHRGETSVEPDVAGPVLGKMPLRAPQHMSPVVDVTNKEPVKEHKEKKASHFALPSYGRYPIDTYGQVKQASAYFEEYGRRMSPVERHEYCVNLVKRAESLLIPVSDLVKKYGSEKYASAHEFSTALDTRRQLLGQEDIVLLDKMASAAPTMEPGTFASMLEAFDHSRGLQHHYDSYVMDPYYSTYGFQKRAEDDENWSDVVGNHVITGKELKTFAMNGWMRLKKQFGLDMAEEFRKDPIGIYNSMPVEQKVLIIRLATENSPL